MDTYSNRLNGLYEKYTDRNLSFWTTERRQLANDYFQMLEEEKEYLQSLEDKKWCDIYFR